MGAGVVRHEMIRVDRAPKELERIVESCHRLQIRQLRAAANRGEGERVELVVQRRGVPGKLDAHIAELTAVVGIGIPAAVRDAIILSARGLRVVGSGALDVDVNAGAAQGPVADDDQPAPVAWLTLTSGLRRREYDRLSCRTNRDDLCATQNEERRAERVEIALNPRAGLDR